MNNNDSQPPAAPDVLIAGWHVHVSRNSLSRGEETVRLEPRTMATLVCLVEKAGEAVTRQELEDAVWPGMVIGYDVLTNTVTKLRKAFGDDSKNPQIIETIPKVGYRLITEVKPVPADESQAETKTLERKLAAILYADVAEYSRLTEADEEGTHQTLRAHLDAISDAITHHNGRVVHYAGDAVLAEFGTVLDALNCAVAVQRDFAAKNTELPADQVVQFRMGINLGDVIVDRDDIYGEGVNVAARLESLADPGGICISEAVRSAVGNKLQLVYDSLGEQHVKNIAEPVRACRVLLDPDARPRRRMPKRSVVAAVTAAVAIVAVGVLGWLQPWAPEFEPAAVERMAFPLPEKPSIAVLPFDNMTGDPGQDFFVDAMTEGIITMLAKVPQLFVIARNSTFTYKGKPVEVRQVAEELGVRYVLEGSVQRSEDRIRVHAQLIDALTGRHVSAERFDTEATDLLKVQDQVAQKVVTGLEVTLTEGEQQRLRRADTTNPEAYDLQVRGRQAYLRYTKADNEQARQLYLKAFELDPQYAGALTQTAWTHVMAVWRGWSENPAQDLKQAKEYAEQALAINDTHPEAFLMMATLAKTNSQYDEAVTLGEKSVSLSPSHAGATALLASYFTAAGRHAEAVETIERAMRLGPYYPNWFLDIAGFAYQFQGNYDKAITAFEGKRDRAPNDLRSYVNLASAYAQAGRQEAAREAAKEVLTRNPKFSIAKYAKRQKYKNPEDLERILDGLRKAGLPENPPLALPDKPSIAVLPFANLNNDPSQDFFSDGITNDIITELYRFDDLMVIASSSVFHYKGKPTKVQQIAKELGVRYVLEGSVQRVDNKVRINVQFIDASTGGHLWAERYDREMNDILAIQDEITEKVTAMLGAYEGEVAEADLARAKRKAPIDLNAYELLLLAREYRHRFNKSDNEKSRELLKQAIQIDSQFARAHAELAWTYLQDVWQENTDTPETSVQKARNHAQKAIELDESFAEGLWVLAAINYAWIFDFDKAAALYERALTLNPTHPDILADYGGFFLPLIGRAEEGIVVIKKAMRLNPHGGDWIDRALMNAYFVARRYEDAISASREVDYHLPVSRLQLIASYAQLGKMEEARAEADEFLKSNPDFTTAKIPLSLFHTEAEIEHVRDGLQKAGLPE